MKLLVSTALAVLSLGTFTSARAADITYEGHLTQGGNTADYTIVTDGAAGFLQSADVVSYSILLSGAGESVEFNQLTPGSYYHNSGDLYYTPAGVKDESSGIFSFFDPAFDSGLFSAHEIYSVGIQVAGLEQVYLLPGPVPFATAVSAAPEPSTWLLMFIAIGGIGMMLRQAMRKMSH